jgi:hemerythrin-like domain-containing protein
MDVAEFVTALKTVEQDHRLVLEKMQALKDTASCLLEPGDRDCRAALGRLREINDYFATQFAAHLKEEEAMLFPFLERQHTEGSALVDRLRRDHEEIRRHREEFGNCLEFGIELEDGVTKMVLRDILIYGYSLWELLDNHAHVETQAVHQCIGQHLHSDLAASPK